MDNEEKLFEYLKKVEQYQKVIDEKTKKLRFTEIII